MKPISRMDAAIRRTLSMLALLALLFCVSALPARAAEAIRVLVVTGGHDFEEAAFWNLFKTMEGITYQAVRHPNFHARLKPEAAKDYDVIVLYDMWQDITPEAQADFVALLEQGKGLVATHHCLVGYQQWEEYRRLIGGKYHLNPIVRDGREIPASTYKHDVDFKVAVAAPDHPVTRGVKDFTIHDETYGRFEVMPHVTPLLTTAEPTSSSPVCWAHRYGNSRVVYLQLGHDHLAYENPGFKKVLRQAIQWTAAGTD